MRLLLIASDPLARAGLSALLSTQPSILIAGQASPVDDLAIAVEVFRPDVILWDVGWNLAQVEEIITTVADSAPPIVALVGSDEIVPALWATGVRGVLNRGSHGEQIAAALLAVVTGLRVSDGEWIPRAIRSPSPEFESDLEPLTDRELEVLQRMAEGLPNKTIARELMISEHTVKFHVNAILGKMQAQSRTEAVVKATRAGLILL